MLHIFNTVPNFYWIFVHHGRKQYMVYSDNELRDQDSRRYKLELNEGYQLVWDSALTRKAADEFIKSEYTDYTKAEIKIRPLSFKEACHYIEYNHRHHKKPQGHKFSIGLDMDGHLIGVLIAGRPVSRHQDDGLTLEITRCCINEAYANSCSKLYRAAYRVAKEMGYRKVITYTLDAENGASLRATGFEFIHISKGGCWNRKSREREDNHPTNAKQLWQLKIG